MYNDEFLLYKLSERIKENAFRILRLPANKTDFCSNDYLGIIHYDLLNQPAHTSDKILKHGSGGSRLLAGNYKLIEDVEADIASFHKSESALIFNSGYDANVGVLSCVPQKDDTILYDQLVHASIRDGIRLSFAQSFSFLHNNMADLEKKLLQAKGNVFVVSESVFSMDGDTCNLGDLIPMCKHFNAHLIIDEAHALGVLGENGEGLVQHINVQQDCFARIYTFGKAAGCHGAAVVGSNRLRDYLVNFSRSFIFSTSLPEVAIEAIRRSYNLFPLMIDKRKHLQQLIKAFVSSPIKYEILPSHTPIQAIIVNGNSEVKQTADSLQKHGFDIRPVLYPSVPKGRERLRIVLHAFNTIEQVNKLKELL